MICGEIVIYRRILAISGGSVSLKKRLQVPIVGVLWRDTILEKCFVNYSETDPEPNIITEIIEHLTEEHYFTNKEIKLVLLFNSIMAGLGIIDLLTLEKKWNTPIIVVSEKEPDKTKILELIKSLNHSKEAKEIFENNPTNWSNVDNTRLFMLPIGIEKNKAHEIIANYQLVGAIPEPLRIADIIAKAIP